MKFWIIEILIILAMGVGGMGLIISLTRKPETKPECLAQVCEKFGHEWGEWEYIIVGALASLELRFFLSDEQAARYAEGARHLWARRCPMCKESEYRCSWSDNTPNCTKDMMDAIRGEIEKERDIDIPVIGTSTGRVDIISGDTTLLHGGAVTNTTVSVDDLCPTSIWPADTIAVLPAIPIPDGITFDEAVSNLWKAVEEYVK